MTSAPGRDAWAVEIERAAATAEAWERCCAPSPRRDQRLRLTLRALVLMLAHYRRLRAGKPEYWGDA
jgi:hypothetical protein